MVSLRRSSSYGERLELIRQDWQEVQAAADEDELVVRSFASMCDFSNEVMGMRTEAWMEAARFTLVLRPVSRVLMCLN